MSLSQHRIFMFILLSVVLALVSTAAAQEGGNVVINSNPQGALVKLSGDINISGVTPIKFDRPLSGQFKIEVIRDGFEKHKSTAFFSETQQSELSINLVPKTRSKAFFRSLIIPGWGQRYYGSNSKSALFTFGTVAAAVGYYFVKGDYDDKADIYNERKAAREAATSWREIEQLDRELYDAQVKANDAENWANVMAAVTVSIYAFNLMDAFLFFPETSRFTEYKALTLKPDVGDNRVSLTLAWEF